MGTFRDASNLYEVERRALHAERPGFRISELQISPTQKVPWHYHTNVQDTFYVIEGRIRLFLREPKEEVRLGPGDTYSVRPRRPHLVANGGDGSATFLVLQGVGEYDYVPSPINDPSARRIPETAGAARGKNHLRLTGRVAKIGYKIESASHALLSFSLQVGAWLRAWRHE
jgi:quercetin dioxygenase-like cupin family protein